MCVEGGVGGGEGEGWGMWGSFTAAIRKRITFKQSVQVTATGELKHRLQTLSLRSVTFFHGD